MPRVIGGLLAAVVLTGACSSDGATNRAADPGETVFVARCAACHGDDAQGVVGPPLVGIADRLTRDEMVTVVTGGRGRMPRFAAVLSEEEIQTVVDYVRRL